MLSENEEVQVVNEVNEQVLILVLMEYALWDFITGDNELGKSSLNPCFNGICSLSYSQRAG